MDLANSTSKIISSTMSKTISKIMNNKLMLPVFLVVLASIETAAMTLFNSSNNIIIATGFVFYIIITFGLVYLVRYKGLAAGHALFDVSSIIIATLVGLIILKEEVTPKKIAGLILAIISVYLLG